MDETNPRNRTAHQVKSHQTDQSNLVNDKENKEPTTVQFDVGGTVYKVSRSLVNAFPQTMLARLISKTWQIDPNATIFIDRNGERFLYILDYMRDKEVHLPLSIPKAALVRDLHYFGFDDILVDHIHAGYGSAEAATQIAKCESLYQQELEQCHRTVRTLQKKITYLNVAHACFLSYSRSGQLSEFYLGDYSLNLMTLKDDINSALESFHKELLDECLELHGLKYVSHRPTELRNCNSIWYYVTLTLLPEPHP